ncbi:thioredoxin family protein [Bacteroides sp. UBA939]|uniref:thioredoxin family protein n=1 Tax=Bacteroides sp. UBA939 TaxID=1946092 RepID=UPI0025BBB149|nr:thioredoxin domain-containing protein [Bacteroides sp. UBA939]
MKKIVTCTVLILASILTFACKDGAKTSPNEAKTQLNDSEQKEAESGEVIVMNKDMFIKDIFDYEKSQEWKYKGDKPAIIDLYADWCGPCRMTAPIMKELAKEYAGKIIIYKVNVDKERELAALFNATSIPLFVFLPMEGEPQLFRGAADKATYKKVIEEFLLKKE